MNKKEHTPLIVHKALEPYLHKSGELFIKIDSDEDLIRFKGSSIDSNFFFNIKSHKKINNTNQILISYQPHNEESVESKSAWINCNNIKGHFDLWQRIIGGYSEIKTVFDDPILKSNTEKFLQKFEIIDENAEFETFDLEQQIFLEEYLENSKEKLKQLKKNQTTEKVIEIEILEKETDEIKNVLTTEPKTKIMARLSKFWGRAQKTGLQVIKEIFVKVAVELGKNLFISQ